MITKSGIRKTRRKEKKMFTFLRVLKHQRLESEFIYFECMNKCSGYQKIAFYNCELYRSYYR